MGGKRREISRVISNKKMLIKLYVTLYKIIKDGLWAESSTMTRNSRNKNAETDPGSQPEGLGET